MDYWKEFCSKIGFDHGDNIPPEAYAVRFAYVETVNKMAPFYGSDVKVAAWNREVKGQNRCMILFVTDTDFQKIPWENILDGDWDIDTVLGTNWDEAKIDEGMDQAINDAEIMDLDKFVELKAVLKQGKLRRYVEDRIEHARQLREDM